MNSKIDLIIAGAQKAGTTSLNKYLAQHPNIFTHFTQEFGMFGSPEDINRGLEKNLLENVEKSFLNHPHKTTFIAKRVGIMYDRQIMQRIFELYPLSKIVVILRNPVRRTFSAFNYCRMNGMEPYKRFEDAIYINDTSRFANSKFKRNCDYIFRSSYLNPILNIKQIFPEKNIKIYLFEEIIKDLNKPLNEMVALLNLPSFDFDTKKNYNEGGFSKSDSFSKLMAPGKFNLVKNFFTVEQRVKLKLFLKRLNTGKHRSKQETLQEDTRNYLINVFKDEVIELEKFIDVPIKKYWPEFFTIA